MLSAAATAEIQDHLLRAQACIEGGRFAEAIAPLRMVTARLPALPEPHFYLALALRQTGHPAGDAAAEFHLAIHHAQAQGRDYPDAMAGLAHALLETGDRKGARATYEAARGEAAAQARRNPSSAEAQAALGVAEMRLCHFPAALKSFQAALRLDGTLHAVRGQLAQALCHLGRYKAAEAACDETLEIAPGDADAHAVKGLALMARGRWREGLHHYRWRWGMADFAARRTHSRQPEWTGQDVAGRIVLVQGEQGFGDAFQFCRFVDDLADRGATVVAMVRPQLVRLLAEMRGMARCLSLDDPLPDHDFHVPLMNLALPFVPADDAIPARAPYIVAPPRDAARGREMLANVPGLKVGLCWAGSPLHLADAQRSLPPGALAPLARAGVSLVSLQQGTPGNEPGPDMLHPGDLPDFAATAGLIAALDLVISVDTAVAHLAGAMGRPVWTLLPHVAEWRWGLAGRGTPWYPTMRLYRQASAGDWKGTVMSVRRDLQAMAEAQAGATGR